MRRLALLSATLLASALPLSCDRGDPVDPIAFDGSVSAARGGGSDLAAPSNATAAGSGDYEITLTWQDNSNESGFEVFRSATGAGGTYALAARIGANLLKHVSSGLDWQTEYCYRVRAIRVTGNKTAYSSYSNIACASPGLLPPPTNAMAVGVSGDHIEVTWQDNSTDETGFYVTRSEWGETGYFANVSFTGANATGYSDRTVRPGTRYCYKVHAVISADGGFVFSSFSAPSNIACVTPPPFSAAPTAVVDVTAQPRSSSTVEVRWRSTSGDAEGFRLYRSTEDGELGALIFTLSGAAYKVDMILGTADEGRQNEQRVCYRVIAFNSAGDAPASPAGCTTPPAAATVLVATRADEQTVDVTWSDNSSVEDKYEVWAAWSSPYSCYGFCNADVQTAFFRMAELPANAASYRCSTCGETWLNEDLGEWGYITQMFVVAVKDGGKSDYSIVEFPQ